MNVPDIETFARGLDKPPDSVTVAVGVPFPHLALAIRAFAPLNIAVGAQNLHEEDGGAYTGEVSGAMLYALGAQYVIVGHSERRAYNSESDMTVNRKTTAALRNDLRPIICVGETAEQRQGGETERVITRQVFAALKGASPEALSRILIAYEPIWAIGTHRAASPQDAEAICRLIKTLAPNVPVLYGGSVSAQNAAELFAQPDIDGGLIGSASLDAGAFSKIINIAASQAAATI
jgi:triosephosphate isomerase